VGAVAAGVDWTEVLLLSLYLAGIGIGRGKIVYSGGDLDVRMIEFVGNGVGK